LNRSFRIIADTKKHQRLCTISWIAPGLGGLAVLTDCYIRDSYGDLVWAVLSLYMAIDGFILWNERLRLYDALLEIGIDVSHSNS
jgi:hypothetical protein